MPIAKVIGLLSALLVNSTPLLAEQALDEVLDGYRLQPIENLLVTRSASVLLIMSGVLPAPEELPSVKILDLSMEGVDGRLVVEAQVRGYLDDAILGENFKAIFHFDDGQWEIIGLGRQTICARGEVAGEVAEICP